MNFGILVLLLALILFGLLAFKQISALILAPLVTIFVIVCSGLPILESLKTAFMPAASDYVTSYFLIFFVGALFGANYAQTECQFRYCGTAIPFLTVRSTAR